MGMNLLDAILGSALFLFCVLAAAPLLTESARATRRSDQLLDATLAAQRQLDALRTGIKRGEVAQHDRVEDSGFTVARHIEPWDADFYRLSVAVHAKGDVRRLVELIALAERP